MHRGTLSPRFPARDALPDSRGTGVQTYLWRKSVLFNRPDPTWTCKSEKKVRESQAGRPRIRPTVQRVDLFKTKD